MRSLDVGIPRGVRLVTMVGGEVVWNQATPAFARLDARYPSSALTGSSTKAVRLTEYLRSSCSHAFPVAGRQAGRNKKLQSRLKKKKIEKEFEREGMRSPQRGVTPPDPNPLPFSRGNPKQVSCGAERTQYLRCLVAGLFMNVAIRQPSAGLDKRRRCYRTLVGSR